MSGGVVLLLVWIVAGCADVPAQDEAVIQIDAGEVDRQGTIASVTVPDLEANASYELVNEDGSSVPVQVQGQEVRFVVNNLAAGEQAEYRLVPSDEQNERIDAREVNGAIGFFDNDTALLEYRAEATAPEGEDIDDIYLRGGYLHPVYSPSGLVVTGDYPPDHRHHHGIWSAWAHTEFEGRQPDFWNMGQGTAAVEAVSVEEYWSGSVHGGVTARHRFVDYTDTEDRTVLEEEWTVHVYDAQIDNTPVHIFELFLTQQNVTDSPLLLPEYRYGGVGFRGNEQWLGEEYTEFLTSEGKSREDGHGTRARWCHIGGEIDGEKVGIAILDHPDNFRSPQPMRIHPNEPFFNFAPQQLGDFTIEPGEAYTAQYRYVVYDGDPDVDLIERLWNDYANPPQVSLLSP